MIIVSTQSSETIDVAYCNYLFTMLICSSVCVYLYPEAIKLIRRFRWNISLCVQLSLEQRWSNNLVLWNAMIKSSVVNHRNRPMGESFHHLFSGNESIECRKTRYCIEVENESPKNINRTVFLYKQENERCLVGILTRKTVLTSKCVIETTKVLRNLGKNLVKNGSILSDR